PPLSPRPRRLDPHLDRQLERQPDTVRLAQDRPDPRKPRRLLPTNQRLRILVRRMHGDAVAVPDGAADLDPERARATNRVLEARCGRADGCARVPVDQCQSNVERTEELHGHITVKRRLDSYGGRSMSFG